MVDSRSKGQRAEYLVRDLFRKYTDYSWERVPQSGALSFIKGDIYIPDSLNNFLVEVKHYEEPILDIKIFTNKSNKFSIFWLKAIEQAEEKHQEPLLIFKHDRSKLYLATSIKPINIDRYIYINWLNCYVLLAEEWLEYEPQDWIRDV